MIIGITGTLGAGKGTIVEYLVGKKGFHHFSARALINEEITKRGLSINRDNMVAVANDMRAKHSPSWVAEELFLRAQKLGGDSVIESLRAVGEVEKLREQPDFIFFAIDADRKIRFERVQQRNDVQSDDVDFQKFTEQEELEMQSTDPTKQNLSACISMADYVFQNNGTIEELENQVEAVLNELRTKEN
ncbi:AAA family ATPase [Candidatus Woesearchaeota archaeon]|nr:AAA family ATPase [Candidatus Woesearchaeota archaeon]